MDQKTKVFVLGMVYLCSFIYLKIIGVNGGIYMSKYEEVGDQFEIENELTRLNKPYVKTIQTKFNEIYDCVDFYKQPAFDHPLLKNHTFNPMMRPSSIPEMKNVSDEFWESSNALDCPVGTVPIRRTTKEDIIRAKLHSKYYSTNNIENSAGNHYAIVKTKLKRYIGGAGILSIWNPPVKSSQYSSSRLKVQNGRDSIQAGWTVNPSLYGDHQTHMYIYVNAGELQCANARCPGFVIVNKDIPIDIVMEPTTGNRRWKGIKVLIHLDTSTGNWWYHFGKGLVPIGFWPGHIFGDLSERATMVEWGGEVYSPPNEPSPPMGSGRAKIGHNTGKDALCGLLSVIEEGGSGRLTAAAREDTELYKDDPHYYIEDDGFFSSDFGHVVLFGGSGGATGSSTN